MSGLIASAQQNVQPQSPLATLGQQVPQQQQPSISPSQEPMGKDYQMFVAKGLDLISSPQTRDSIVTMLKAGDPVTALANALVVILQKLDIAARAKGLEVADIVKLYGSHELISELSNVGKAAGIFNLDSNHIELAFSVAVQNYIKGEIAAGRIDPQKLQAQSQASAKKLDPKQRASMQEAVQRIQATAKSYSAQQQQGGQA